EAFMYRFHPRTERAVEIATAELSSVHTFSGAFHFSMGDRSDDVRLDPSLAGGSTMDVGVYPIDAARTFLGHPDRVSATTVDRRDAGVDTEMAAVLEYDDGSVARVASGFDAPLTQRYRVGADDGWLEVRSAFDAPDDEALTIEWARDGERRTETVEPVDQYRLEVEHFARAVAADATPRVDAADTLGTMAVVDAIAESAGSGGAVDVRD
ncbi:MAG: Gfo/Idh/MocA family protein, partial [Halanaeroarchaeum sp.]